MKDKATPKRPFKELQSDQAIGLQSKSMKVANKITQERFQLDNSSRDVLELILQHLPSKEYLQVSLVSPKIYRMIGTSENFAQKIQLQIKDLKGLKTTRSRFNLNAVMKKSKRSYKHIHLRATEIGEDELGLLFRNEWKSAVIAISDIKRSSQLIKYLNLMMPSITTLQLSIGNIKKVDPNLKLDVSCCLKILIFSECSSSALEIFVRDECNYIVQDLKLSAVRQSISKNAMKISRIYTRLMETFNALVHLDVGSSVCADDLFKSDISELTRFHLNSFRIEAPSSPAARENVEKFLMSQGSTLVDVCLLAWNQPETIYTIWSQMTELKVFQMSIVQSPVTFNVCQRSLTNIGLKNLILNIGELELTHGYLEPLLRASFPMDEIQITIDCIQEETLDLIKEVARKVVINGEIMLDEVSLESEYDNGTSDDEPSEPSSDSSADESAAKMKMPTETILIDSD